MGATLKHLVLVVLAAVAACGRSQAGNDDGQYSTIAAMSRPAGETAEAAEDMQRLAMGPVAQQASRPRGNLLRLEPQVILDATGFAQPTAAATIFVPHGWRTEGGVFWANDFSCTNGYNFIWSASPPDRSMSIGIAPQTAWEMNTANSAPSRPGCQLMPLQSTRAYLQSMVQRSVPGARILDYRDRPDLVREIGVQPSRTPMPMGEIRRWAEGGEILFAFNQNGRDMRGSMMAAVQFDLNVTDTSQMFANDPTIGPGGMQGMQTRSEFLSAFAYPGWVATAPNGQFNFAFFEALRKSIKTNPQWANAIAGHNAAIGRVALKESQKRAQAIMETNDYISRLRQETWNAQQESADRRAREFGEVIRGVETYKDEWGPGGQTELSGHYNNAWRLNDGSYVLTDDPNFDPWRDLRLEGKKLEAVR